jgi:vitamin-K-epoxide reductase (warfarin-sensitive)|tara:strand:+ start:254 stop:1486 length:1233 start_codon:yes stop_codon:yes gene_type:complete
MSPLVRRIVLALALVGFASAATSTYVHYQLALDAGYTSFCDINESVSCTQVYLSRFGSVGGIPVALLGAFWFGFVGLLALAAGRGGDALAENVGGYLLVLSTVGLATVLFLGYTSFMVLGAVCLLCVVVYVAVIGIFLSSGAVGSVPWLSIPRRAVSDLGRLVRTPVALIVALVYLGATAATVMMFQIEPASAPVLTARPPSDPATGPAESADTTSEIERFWDAQPRVELSVSREGAQVLVVKFNDYECPSCAATYLAYEPIFARFESSHPGAVRHVNLDYPLDPECNDQTPRGMHAGACEAAVAVRLARREGRDESMSRWLYENQQSLSRESVRDALERITGMSDFDALYEATLEDVKADIALGGLIAIEATPTFVVNGVMLKGGLQPQYFEAAIALELERASAGPASE